MKPSLTIAIPTYNRAGLLRRALSSALAQTSEEIEIIVSDNGSSDETKDLLAQYSDSRLRKFRHDVTMSRAEHGTFLFHQIKTEVVLILSDDDYLEPEFSSEVIKLFNEHPEVSFVYTGYIEHYDDAILPALAGPHIESPLDFFAAYYAGHRNVSWSACVTRVEDILECGPQPSNRIIGDMFFWSRIGFKGPVGCVPRALSHYTVLRPGGDNESRTVPILTWGKEVKLLTEEVMRNISRTGASVTFQNAIKADMERYTARSVANQFIWARISGMSRLDCLSCLPASLHFNGWAAGSVIRVCAALVLPRLLLRYLVVSAASRMALKRTAVSVR